MFTFHLTSLTINICSILIKWKALLFPLNTVLQSKFFLSYQRDQVMKLFYFLRFKTYIYHFSDFNACHLVQVQSMLLLRPNLLSPFLSTTRNTPDTNTLSERHAVSNRHFSWIQKVINGCLCSKIIDMNYY